jgi:cytochrome c553
MRRFALTALLLLLARAGTAADLPAALSDAYANTVHPFLVKTCGKCHGDSPKDNDLNIKGIATASAMLAQPAALAEIRDRVAEGDMPPKKATQPTLEEKEALLAWIAAAQDHAASARAGDPGPVTLRRLTNTEYDNAIRDLTGIDMRPTRANEFPPDSVGGEGFANVGEAMPVTPNSSTATLKPRATSQLTLSSYQPVSASLRLPTDRNGLPRLKKRSAHFTPTTPDRAAMEANRPSNATSKQPSGTEPNSRAEGPKHSRKSQPKNT